MPIDKTKITQEMLTQAMECQTAEELMALCRTKGFDINKEEAESYLAELENTELDSESLSKVAGGYCYGEGVDTDNVGRP